MNAVKRAEHRGDYALACALLIRRDTRLAWVDHYRAPLTVALYLPGVALWAYLVQGLFFS